MQQTSRRSVLALAAAGLLALAGPARADYPEKTIRLVVPFGGGGMGTVFGTMVSEELAKRLKSPVVAEYKPGANAAIGSREVAKAAPDGYTLLMVTTGSLTINPVFYPKLGYDPLKDFTPVSMVWLSRNVLYANPAKAKTLKELVQAGGKEPLRYGSLGAGTLAHLSGEMLLRQNKLEGIHAPYKGNGPVLAAVAGGELDFAFGDPAGLQLASSGKVNALAVTGTQRLSTAPQVPTLAEQGYPNVGTMSWLGIVAPAGTPKPIVDRISKELAEIFGSEEMKAKVASHGVEVAPNLTPEYFAKEIRTELDRWSKFQKETGIVVEQ